MPTFPITNSWNGSFNFLSEEATYQGTGTARQRTGEDRSTSGAEPVPIFSTGKSGRAVSAESADAIAQAIDGGEAIASHQRATPAIATLASEAVGHLRRALASNAVDENDGDADQDNDGDMGYDDGNPTGSAAIGDRLLLSEAQSLVCRMTAYELLTGAALLRATAGRFTDAAVRIERHLAASH